jgi:geranylgeranyl diphosphate synthase type II
LPSNLREAARYALLGPGKRLRPILVIRSCEAVGAAGVTGYPAAAAIEMVHCFSLVHDDLPAMDDDDLRRGRPTLHRHTNEAMAILAGDLLSTLAFEHLSGAAPAGVALQLVRELAQATDDMIAGQVYDTLPDFPTEASPLERLETVHRHKTGALIRCACRMGAIAGGATPVQLQALTAYAESIGLMFQVIDDLLDVTQSTEHLGKAAGKDAGRGKLTYPGLLGVEESRREVDRLLGRALDALASLPGREGARRLAELARYMAVRTR